MILMRINVFLRSSFQKSFIYKRGKFLDILKYGGKEKLTSGDLRTMAHSFKNQDKIREKDLGKFISDFDKFQSSASLKRQHRAKSYQVKNQDFSREDILDLDKNKLVFLIYWQNVKKVARKFRNAYFFELSQRSLRELQKEALADLVDTEEIQSIMDLVVLEKYGEH